MKQAYRWTGWWFQDGCGRQQMHDLDLQFDAGSIQGDGHDMVGEFTFSGTFDENGVVSMLKQYIGMHYVIYRGMYDGEGTIHGEWEMTNGWVGPFAITLKGGTADEEEEIATFVPEPHYALQNSAENGF